MAHIATVLGVSRKDLVTNNELYGNLPKVTSKIKEKRMKLARQAARHKKGIFKTCFLGVNQR